ncbi:hypothetical protein [Saccharothrix carnea]|nr:hypothetical protein [Saccharothrix carnea]
MSGVRARVRSITARCTHVWRVANGLVHHFEQIADTATIAAART